MSALLRLEAEGILCAVDLAVGHIAELTVERDGARSSPLHRAPWVGDADGEFPEATPPNVRRLSGDFLCAPFGRNDIEPAPSHGWPANSAWTLLAREQGPTERSVRLELEKRVFGARVEKVLRLRDGHPFLYQEHILHGGEGALSVAHHTMTRMDAGGTLAVSRKAFAETPGEPLEPDPARGRHALAYPAKTADLSRFPLHGGGTCDLHAFPPAEVHEDFLTLAEADCRAFGWTAVSRRAESDALLVLKNAADLPVAMLWMSNGGRDYAPWNGRHSGVLGIEDARASALGHRGSIEPNGLNAAGIPTAITLRPDGAVAFRQVIGAMPLPAGRRVTGLEPRATELVATLDAGPALRLPFDGGFLATPLI